MRRRREERGRRRRDGSPLRGLLLPRPEHRPEKTTAGEQRRASRFLLVFLSGEAAAANVGTRAFAQLEHRLFSSAPRRMLPRRFPGARVHCTDCTRARARPVDLLLSVQNSYTLAAISLFSPSRVQRLDRIHVSFSGAETRDAVRCNARSELDRVAATSIRSTTSLSTKVGR